MNSKKTFWIILAVAIVVIGGALILKGDNGSSAILWKISKEGSFLLPLIIFSAIIDSINPCAVSILVITLGFLLSLKESRRKILTIGATYIAGIFVAYILIGLGILKALHIFGVPHFMGILGAYIVIVVGILNVIEDFFPNFPIKLKIPSFAHKSMGSLIAKMSLPAAFILGALVGLCEFPCTGGPYLMVLGLLHDMGTYSKGVMYLILYNMIFILPLAIILALASSKVILEKVEKFRSTELSHTKFWIGITLIIIGILILFVV